MRAAGILFIGLMMSSATWADGSIESPPTLIHTSRSAQSTISPAQPLRSAPLQQTLPAQVSVFFPQGPTHFGLCWQGLTIDSNDNLYPVGVGHLFKLLPDGTLVNGLNDQNFFASGGISFWAELDEAGGNFYAAAGPFLRKAPFVEGSTFSVLLSGLVYGHDVALGRGSLAGSLLVTDSGASRIARVTLAPLALSTFASQPSFFPEAIVSAPDGSLYTARLGIVPTQLIKITPAGVASVFAIGTVPQVNRAVAVDDAGNVYWSHAQGINKYSPSGNLLGTLPGPPDKPVFENLMGAVFDSQGNLFVVENFGCKKIYKYTLALTVGVDVRSSINPKSKGVIPVVILTTDAFDATTIDPRSVRFGPGGATEAHGRGHIEDVDGDGDLDLVLHFRTQDARIPCGSTSASLSGQTFDGQSIEGTDAIRMTGCR